MFRNYIEIFLSVFQWNLRIPLRHLTSRLHWARWKYKLTWFYYHSRMSEKSKVEKSVLYWRRYSFMATALSWVTSAVQMLFTWKLCSFYLPANHRAPKPGSHSPKVSCFPAKEAILPWCLLYSSWRSKTAGGREAEWFTWNFQAEPRERAGHGSETISPGSWGMFLAAFQFLRIVLVAFSSA